MTESGADELAPRRMLRDALVVNLGATPESQRRWIESWRFAGLALEDIKRDELLAMTEEQARVVSDALLQGIEFPRPPSWRDHNSGLVEQQRIFHSKRPQR